MERSMKVAMSDEISRRFTQLSHARAPESDRLIADLQRLFVQSPAYNEEV